MNSLRCVTEALTTLGIMAGRFKKENLVASFSVKVEILLGHYSRREKVVVKEDLTGVLTDNHKNTD